MNDLPADKNAEDAQAHLPWESIGAGEQGETAVGANAGGAECGIVADQAGREASAADALMDEGPDSAAQSWTDQTDPMPGFATEDGPESEPEAMAQPRAKRARQSVPPTRGGGWTISVLCAGIALAACCVLIPQADANRRLVYGRQMLKMDLATVERQISVNQEFLKKVSEDPALAQRLAERQMKVIPAGTRVLELRHEQDGSTMSPFQLVSVAPPAPLPPYHAVGGTIANLCYNSHTRLYVIATALLMMAAGLVLGYAPEF